MSLVLSSTRYVTFLAATGMNFSASLSTNFPSSDFISLPSSKAEGDCRYPCWAAFVILDIIEAVIYKQKPQPTNLIWKEIKERRWALWLSNDFRRLVHFDGSPHRQP